MLPSGVILLWFGSVGTIPSGYVICDGNNSTPDLRNKFIVGAGDTYAVDAVGGNINHTHNFSAAPHFHTLQGGGLIGGGASYDDDTTSEISAGTTDAQNGLPPYHALCYIMKT